MLCRKYIGLFTSFCLLFLLSLFFSSPVSAINDITEEYNGNSGAFVFANVQGPTLAQYKYLVVKCIPVDPSLHCGSASNSTPNTLPWFRVRWLKPDSSGALFLSLSFTVYDEPTVVPLPSYNSPTNSSTPSFLSFYNSFSTYNVSKVSYTLTNTLPFEADCPPGPSGSIDITENGTVDVSDYATANVNVPQNTEAPYNDKLDDIKKAIYVCAGTALVIYFFYCIYRMIIKGSGVR